MEACPTLATLERFSALWRRCHTGKDALDPHPMYEEIVRRYGEPQRHYHVLTHVDDCLRRFDLASGLMANADEVELALWFHDIVYEPGSRDNERCSAALYLHRAYGAPRLFAARVASLILISRHIKAARVGDRRYLVDIDLGGFGLPWEEFMAQSNLVRAEFADIPEEQFCAGQGRFMEGLLARPRFFVTDFFHDRLELQARRNVNRMLDDWVRAGYLSSRV